MYELGKKSEIFGTDLLKPLNLYGRPTSMPTLVGNEMVIWDTIRDWVNA